MAQRVIRTTKRLAAERQIHAAIAHFRTGDFECAITLCSAAENQMPEPDEPTHLFRVLQKAVEESPARDDEKVDFNFTATWMKHVWGRDEVEIEEFHVVFWLNRAISKYRAVYGIGTAEMAGLFLWASNSSRQNDSA